MAKLLLFLSLFIFVISCNENPCTSTGTSEQKAEANPATACPATDPIPSPDPIPKPIPVTGEDVPNEAFIFDAEIKLFNFERDDEDKLYKAIEIIKKVVASSEFRDRVLNFTYQGKKQFVDNKGMTNAQIYQALLDGREVLRPEIDHEMDLELELYYASNSTVGYTTRNVLRIHMNTKYFDPYTLPEVAGNVFHEWTHKLGFEHATSYSVSRDSTVPYAIGYLIKELGVKYQ